MYYIMEIQEQDNSTSEILTYKKSTKYEALSKYYEILRDAAISSVPTHTIILVENDGRYIARESFSHRSIE